jgi:hypothetical protein
MPAWGNHEWDDQPTIMNNYKGRFDLPTWQTSQVPGNQQFWEDWYYDYGTFVLLPTLSIQWCLRDWNTHARFSWMKPS